MAWGRKPSCECGACQKCRHRIYMRGYYNRLSPEERRKKFVESRDPERVRADDRRRYHEKQKLDDEAMKRRRANTAVNNAIRRGDLERGACEACGRPDAHGHHDDYDQPLDVRWLCPPCHAQEHKDVAA